MLLELEKTPIKFLSFDKVIKINSLLYHLQWENRTFYLKLLKKFLEDNIHCLEFCYEFQYRSQLNDKILLSLKSNVLPLTISINSEKFGQILSDISEICMSYESANSEAALDLVDQSYRNEIKKLYLKLNNTVKDFEKI